MTTIQELVERRRELVAELAEIDAEIRSRHGQTDGAGEPAAAEETAAKKTAAKTQAKT